MGKTESGLFMITLLLSSSLSLFASSENQTATYTQNKGNISTSSVLNNPFLEKRVEELLKKAIDKIVKEKIDEIKKEESLKYTSQILQLKLKNLELQKKITQLQLEINRLKKQLKGNSQKKEKTLPKIEVVNITQVGNFIELKTSDGQIITKGSEINGYIVVDIKPQEQVLILRNKTTGKIVRVHYILKI